MESAYEWKRYYEAERARLGTEAMLALVDDAQSNGVLRSLEGGGGAIVIPHTRFEITGDQIAAAVAMVLASGVDRVLALGVLHGARRIDRQRVDLARGGDVTARDELRGVHDEDGLAAEEFSLDAFSELMSLAAAREDRCVEVLRCYPFLVGDDPTSLPGIRDLEQIVDAGALIVATTDPVHHGHAYGTPETQCADPAQATTIAAARTAIDDQLRALSEHRFADFERLVERDRSDFRDTGPVLAHLLGPHFASEVHGLALVDYAGALNAPAPSWVAGALVTISVGTHR